MVTFETHLSVYSLDLPCDEYKPKNDEHFDCDVHPTAVERDGSQVVEPANSGRIFERFRGPHIAHGHDPENVHYYQ